MRGSVVVVKQLFGVALLALCAAGPVWAQDEEAAETPAADSDWIVYVEEAPLQCWVVSTPVERVNMRDGEVAEGVRRDESLFYVSFWPEQNRRGEVSMTLGYGLVAGATQIEIGEASFETFSEGETAWALSVAEDSQIVEAMIAGTEMVVSSTSARGTLTRDTYTLVGFSAAIADARLRCDG